MTDIQENAKILADYNERIRIKEFAMSSYELALCFVTLSNVLSDDFEEALSNSLFYVNALARELEDEGLAVDRKQMAISIASFLQLNETIEITNERNFVPYLAKHFDTDIWGKSIKEVTL